MPTYIFLLINWKFKLNFNSNKLFNLSTAHLQVKHPLTRSARFSLPTFVWLCIASPSSSLSLSWSLSNYLQCVCNETLPFLWQRALETWCIKCHMWRMRNFSFSPQAEAFNCSVHLSSPAVMFHMSFVQCSASSTSSSATRSVLFFEYAPLMFSFRRVADYIFYMHILHYTILCVFSKFMQILIALPWKFMAIWPDGI